MQLSVRNQFSKIIANVVSVMRLWKPKLSKERDWGNDHYVHLANALCWTYTAEDHDWLAKLGIFDVMLRGDGEIMHPLRTAWGRDNSQLKIIAGKDSNLCLPSYLWQTFLFIVSGVTNTALNNSTAENATSTD